MSALFLKGVVNFSMEDKTGHHISGSFPRKVTMACAIKSDLILPTFFFCLSSPYIVACVHLSLSLSPSVDCKVGHGHSLLCASVNAERSFGLFGIHPCCLELCGTFLSSTPDHSPVLGAWECDKVLLFLIFPLDITPTCALEPPSMLVCFHITFRKKSATERLSMCGTMCPPHPHPS